jgi:hypothetical protein
MSGARVPLLQVSSRHRKKVQVFTVSSSRRGPQISATWYHILDFQTIILWSFVSFILNTILFHTVILTIQDTRTETF